MRFFVGLHHPSDAWRFGACFLSVHALRRRKAMAVHDWILDSGAFTEISRHGEYRTTPDEYATEIRRWSSFGTLLAAVAQDYMCEPDVLRKTGGTVELHQEKTIARYDALLACNLPVPILPVLQGYSPADYRRHIRMYGARLRHDHWVGVGSVCKRNGDPRAVLEVIDTIRQEAPGLWLHGFGLKTATIRVPEVRCQLYSADSMAWSYQARKQGRNANDPREAIRWAARFGYSRNGETRETSRSIWQNSVDPEYREELRRAGVNASAAPPVRARSMQRKRWVGARDRYSRQGRFLFASETPACAESMYGIRFENGDVQPLTESTALTNEHASALLSGAAELVSIDSSGSTKVLDALAPTEPSTGLATSRRGAASTISSERKD